MRYGIAIKALPKGGKPFGDEEDDEQPEGTEEETLDDTDPAALLEQDPAAGEAPAPEDEEPSTEEPVDGEELLPSGEAPSTEPEEPPAAPEPPADDGRPWAGDMYDEGDETDPADAWAAYQGSTGEEAWLDRAEDGTLTGWVRDGTGQVWRYTDPDAWAVDVEGAQMTNTHRQGRETADQPGTPPADRGVQDSMFQGS
jgi:hypothetical protein